ncbi:TonB-dependent receptor [Mucinivorans hirudinis]|uniref:TonB-dependent receptor n=1 Tax=Mucinivorans hirudinis TaxID=1433126 RepID=A0A060R5V3_9BACT|nr:TonB-dependent receptor [Mucinivorans hirudinis]
MKRILYAIILIVISLQSKSQIDTTRTLEQVVVLSSTKETNRLGKIPTSVTIITPLNISRLGVESIKNISSFVPNLYIPDYGSKMTTAIYLRGIGTRSSGQSVGMYLNNIPMMDKSTLDFELMDIQRIEVLRGAQGTLYGRNAMSGIINIYTLLPLDYQGTKIALGAANYDSYSAKFSNYSLICKNTGLAVMGYYDKSAGYFTNVFTGKRADPEESAGGRLKLDSRLTNNLLMNFETSFDFTNQGAFAYGLYDKETKKIADVNYNDEGSYRRAMMNNSLRFEYSSPRILWSSSTGYQYLNDDMKMDQDFTAKSIFTINQRQNQHSFNQEFAARSTTLGRYQWSAGAFGFYNLMRTNGDVTFCEDGVREILQPVFDKMMPPTVPVKITINNKEIPNPGFYKTPAFGAAIFHQSTYNFTNRFSVTAGLRLDYEKQWLYYNTSMAMNTTITSSYMPRPIPFDIAKTLTGNLSQSFIELLPKIAVKYECTEDIMTYATVSKGYKAGGYNIQMFSEVIQDSLKTVRPPIGGAPAPKPKEDRLSETVSYKPETSWNYEAGFRAKFGFLKADVALFYMDIRDLQLTQFVDGGSGRILSNAGRGRSFGADVSLNASLTDNLSVDLNYGYVNSKFVDYKAGVNKEGVEVDYSGNFIPYTPANTLSLGASYSIPTGGKFIKQILISADYSGYGKIYWTEANDITQPFYGLLGGKISLRHSLAKLEIWGRNLTNTEYGAFYFESFGRSFVQKGKPTTFGVNLIFNLNR